MLAASSVVASVATTLESSCVWSSLLQNSYQKTVILQTTIERSAQYVIHNVEYIVGDFESSLIFQMTLVLASKRLKILLHSGFNSECSIIHLPTTKRKHFQSVL